MKIINKLLTGKFSYFIVGICGLFRLIFVINMTFRYAYLPTNRQNYIYFLNATVLDPSDNDMSVCKNCCFFSLPLPFDLPPKIEPEGTTIIKKKRKKTEREKENNQITGKMNISSGKGHGLFNGKHNVTPFALPFVLVEQWLTIGLS